MREEMGFRFCSRRKRKKPVIYSITILIVYYYVTTLNSNLPEDISEVGRVKLDTKSLSVNRIILNETLDEIDHILLWKKHEADHYDNRELEQFMPPEKGEFGKKALTTEPRDIKETTAELININVVSVPKNVQPNETEGPGEFGRGVDIDKEKLSVGDRKKYDEDYELYAFNNYLSEMISVNRSLPYVAPAECRDIQYSNDLPAASVIIIFHNEAWTVLQRTVYSVLNRSPPTLIREVILVDDCSTMEHLHVPLTIFVDSISKLRLIRASKRVGLIQARLLGASAALGEILIFLDSHCEATPGWLEPLLFTIKTLDNTVVVPLIDTISHITFQYIPAINTMVGGFTWNLVFNWHDAPLTDRGRNVTDPIRSPTMAGGLFAIRKSYFEHLGTYDSKMEFWGAENLELSFRIWMCGGQLMSAPCSHVGHIFRENNPTSRGMDMTVIKKNSVRLAEVWLDEYKDIFYDAIGLNKSKFDPGDLSDRIALRRRLHCDSFKWYLDNVYPSQFNPMDAVARGAIQNIATPICLDGPIVPNKKAVNVTTWPCHNQGGNQFWILSKQGEIRRLVACMDYSSSNGLQVIDCHGQHGNQMWSHLVNGWIRHEESGLCLELSTDGRALSMATCSDSDQQKWFWSGKFGKKYF